jgi:Squalene-hopene cyclase C-terminal domain/Prenyltransferase and squalene oxidase repeat
MTDWRSILHYDPLPSLLSSGDSAIALFTAQDLLEQTDVNVKTLWDLPEAKKIVSKQQPDGSWKYPGGNTNLRTAENYDQIETFRNLGYLVEMYGFNKSHPVIVKAADFLLGFQTDEGDIRGILGTRYTPYYTAAMLELLIKAGYADDQRIEKALQWLSSTRQNDGGWALPLRTQNKKLDIIALNAQTLEPERSRPFSHLITGVVLRAYAVHPTYHHSVEAKLAGKLLLSHLFKKDNYPDRSSPGYWLRFTYPFWFTDLISATDSLSKLGFKKEEPEIAEAIQWFIAHQHNSGLWKLKTLKNQKKYHTDLWISLAICRILRRLV